MQVCTAGSSVNLAQMPTIVVSELHLHWNHSDQVYILLDLHVLFGHHVVQVIRPLGTIVVYIIRITSAHLSKCYFIFPFNIPCYLMQTLSLTISAI